jgi:hypothetical protein
MLIGEGYMTGDRVGTGSRVAKVLLSTKVKCTVAPD